MFNIELESRSKYFKLWNRKLFVVEHEAELLIHLQTAESRIGELRFIDAIRNEDKV
jgi:hypothetical protein